MKLSLAVALAEYEMERFFPALKDWKVATSSKSKRVQALCDHKRKLIVLSENYVNINSVNSVRNTVLHEIAHALVGPGHGHDAVWKAQALALGISPDRLDWESVQPKGKYQAVCPHCGKLFNLYRKPKISARFCRKCGQSKGSLSFFISPS